eukprot:1159617-Pelagomonas_calceolata.AAC.1
MSAASTFCKSDHHGVKASRKFLGHTLPQCHTASLATTSCTPMTHTAIMLPFPQDLMHSNPAHHKHTLSSEFLPSALWFSRPPTTHSASLFSWGTALSWAAAFAPPILSCILRRRYPCCGSVATRGTPPDTASSSGCWGREHQVFGAGEANTAVLAMQQSMLPCIFKLGPLPRTPSSTALMLSRYLQHWSKEKFSHLREKRKVKEWEKVWPKAV